MELVERLREKKEPVQIQVQECEDPFNRADPIKDAVCLATDWAVAILLLPIWIVNYFFPLQYFTSWYRLLIVVEVLIVLASQGTLVLPAVFSGSIWIIGISVPISSTVIIVYATDLRDRVTQKLDIRVYMYYHCLMHILPSEIFFAVSSFPQPPFLFSTALVIVYHLVYATVLYLVYGHSFLSNYYIVDEREQLPVLVLWCTSLFFSCFIMEYSFFFLSGR